MATLLNAADVHAAKVVDRNGGYEHTRRPLRGVQIHITLSDTEMGSLIRFVRRGGHLASLLGDGMGRWHLARITPLLCVEYGLTDNPYGTANTAEIVARTFATVQEKLTSLRVQEE